MSEHQHEEWKASWRDEYLKWVCGFANAEGGALVIGRDDAGAVVGLHDAHRLLEELPNKVRDLLGIMVDVNLRTDAGLDYLEIAVPAYPNPISYRAEYYYRSGSTNQALKGAALDRFLLRKQGRHWDGVPVPGVAMADLSAAALERFRRSAGKSKRLSQELLRDDDALLIDKLHLVEDAYLRRAAVLLFHPDPERYVTGAYLKIGRFSGEGDLRYQDEVHGNLFEQVNRAMDLLLTKYLEAHIAYAGVQRTETYPVPEEALREALLNAIAHKDYASSAPVQISVYDDRIVFWNSGQLQDGWTIATLRGRHASQPPNPDIANAFFRAGMIESWGLGIEKMRRACMAQGSPEPVLREEVRGLWVEFGFTPAQTQGKMPVKTPVKTPDLVLATLAEHPSMTLAEVAAHIGKSASAVERAASKLIKAQRLKRVGRTKGSQWKVLK